MDGVSICQMRVYQNQGSLFWGVRFFDEVEVFGVHELRDVMVYKGARDHNFALRVQVPNN